MTTLRRDRIRSNPHALATFVTVYRLPTTVYRLPSTDYRLPSTDLLARVLYCCTGYVAWFHTPQFHPKSRLALSLLPACAEPTRR